ncbi:hypothetical protein TVAG_007210 [Trichomonas vaginalis G3]|uniref:Surface antigen BspA-like n=1 Tax=Trichomonas vaginalis (strain ATCC PRA-98 / G3) TaxID=412133 RepID=A2F4I2_TRIV3|nr:leucine-rich repeats (6 copies)-containing protein [Trichomonas vaginalis G3]EAY00191.1 hypothetical protein TVAG_007210 [Trichomonas vaginalis G3]KAI5536143.1 leucine-rich repeats (6 copies)-containing protein [Trichomonas vaginalis G3]|eukprot:XP_001313120.1 hypothetical protein [Trichomonas vaginalis G3]
MNLREIKLPTTLKSIEYRGFFRSGLPSIVIPNTVTLIGSEAFKDCYSLNQIIFSTNLEILNASAFENSFNSAIVDLPNNLKSINDYCFRNSSITQINFGSSIESIGHYSFYDCHLLTSLQFPDKEISLGNYSFSGKSSIKEISIHSKLTGRENHPFFNMSDINKITYGENRYNISRRARLLYESKRNQLAKYIKINK